MRQIWSPQSEKLLRELYPDHRSEDLVELLGFPVGKIRAKASRIKIKKSDAFLKSNLSGRLNGVRGRNTRFKKGQDSWNKGKKQSEYMSAEMIERSAKTRFALGSDPHNTVEIGHIRMTRDGYLEMKVRHDKSGRNKNFVLLQRLIYEHHFGVIGEGNIVEFVDGNPLNLDINNLRLCTRVENLIRNITTDKSIVKRFFGIKSDSQIMKVIADLPDVIELKRKTILLNHQINKNYAK
jgi:hypothetical protein